MTSSESNEATTKLSSKRDRFSSIDEYDDFLAAIESSPLFQSIDNQMSTDNLGFHQKWFRKVDTGEIWRLVEPDFPFRGCWEPVYDDVA